MGTGAGSDTFCIEMELGREATLASGSLCSCFTRILSCTAALASTPLEVVMLNPSSRC